MCSIHVLVNIHNRAHSVLVDSCRDLVSHSSQQRCVLAIVIVRVRVRHLLELAVRNSTDSPSTRLFGLFEELLVLFKAAATGFGLVEIGPDSSEHVREAEDKEEPVVKVVEEDGCQECNSKVSQTPDNDTDSCALRTSSSREDLSGNKLCFVSMFSRMIYLTKLTQMVASQPIPKAPVAT